MKKDRQRRFGTALLVFSILASCSVQKNQSALSFFFDGVPNPKEIRQQAIADSLNAVALATSDSSVLLAVEEKPEFFIHQPYLERKCADCHNQGRMGDLSQSMPGLCYNCHDNFGNKYAFEHGPVNGGYCTQCHDPHRAKEENLLVRTGQEMCFHCHETTQLYKSPFHDSNDETNCTSCHNPHGSNNHSLLNPGSCYSCHENFNETYKVVHGPVAGGYCTNCHLPHRSGTEKLLVRNGRDLCLHCHDGVRMLAIKNHYGSEKLNCTICHNPHGGDGRFMFNK